jgi:hypothetical protein
MKGKDPVKKKLGSPLKLKSSYLKWYLSSRRKDPVKGSPDLFSDLFVMIDNVPGGKPGLSQT